MEHKITIKNLIRVYKGGIQIAEIPAEFDFSAVPPIYHLKCAGAVQEMGGLFVFVDGHWPLKDDEGKIRMRADGSLIFPGDDDAET